jgi:hypothetical protein
MSSAAAPRHHLLTAAAAAAPSYTMIHYAAGGGLFGPDALMRLAMDSRTRHLMEDKEFQGMLQGLMSNPGMIGAHLNDPRMQLVRRIADCGF